MNIFDFFLSSDDLYKKHLNGIEFATKYKNEPPPTPEELFLSLFSGEQKQLISKAINKNNSSKDGIHLREWMYWLSGYPEIRVTIKPDGWNIVHELHYQGSCLMTVTYRTTLKDFIFTRLIGERSKIYITEIE